jgi:YegS/Rv2252/BmrU family lipid kinase
MTSALQHKVVPLGSGSQDVAHRRSAAAQRAVLIHNPAAGLFRPRMRSALAVLAAGGFSVEVRHTAGRGDARRLARDVPDDVGSVFVAGGDGTFNEALNGLMERPPPRPVLGLLPCGTANVLARELGLPLRPDHAARALIAAEPQAIYPGRVDGRYFSVMVGVGMDAQVVANLSPALKRHLGRIGYTVETLRQMFFHAPPRMTVVADGVEYRAHSIIAANARYYGGGFRVAPNARATRRGLELCLLEGRGSWTVFAQTAAVILGRHLKRRDVRIVPARSIRVDGPEGAPVQADGELVGRLPATIEAPADWVRILMPPDPTAPEEARPAVRLMAGRPPPADAGS